MKLNEAIKKLETFVKISDHSWVVSDELGVVLDALRWRKWPNNAPVVNGDYIVIIKRQFAGVPAITFYAIGQWNDNAWDKGSICLREFDRITHWLPMPEME